MKKGIITLSNPGSKTGFKRIITLSNPVSKTGFKRLSISRCSAAKNSVTSRLPVRKGVVVSQLTDDLQSRDRAIVTVTDEERRQQIPGVDTCYRAAGALRNIDASAATTSKDANEGLHYPAHVCVRNTEGEKTATKRLQRTFNFREAPQMLLEVESCVNELIAQRACGIKSEKGKKTNPKGSGLKANPVTVCH